MVPTSSKSSTPRSSGLLRRADQTAVAFLVLVGLGASVGWYVWHGARQGRLIELEEAAPRMASFQVDINAADWPELAQLPGVGETLARRIVQSRESDGPFVDHDDLRRVRGIGPKTLDQIRPLLLPMPDGRAVAGR